MERIRNFISPRTRRKKLDLGVGNDITPTPKVFGVSLHELMLRESPNALVPQAVAKICHYIYKFGLDQVGLFRVCASVLVVEKMRMRFDLTGEVNFEEENDVAATAGLLKVFLRDLPELLIPAALTSRFFCIVKDSSFMLKDKLEMMRNTLRSLPEENLQLLKYICSLLVVVAENEEENKMSAYTLAILFGPNVFTYQVTSGLDGMRDMDNSRDVMQLFISNYNFLFCEKGEPSPREFWENCDSERKKSPPARPPPPKLVSTPSTDSFSSSSSVFVSADTSTTNTSSTHSPPPPSLAPSDYRPVPSPRKMKSLPDSQPSVPSGSSISGVDDGEEDDGHEKKRLFLSLHSQPDSVPLFSPREEIDHSRSHSPFGFESDTHSIIESPMVTARTNEFVEKTIVETISEHIFGVFDMSQNSGSHSPTSPTKFIQDDGDSVDGPPVATPVVKPRTSTANRNRTMASASSQENLDWESKIPQNFDELQSSDLLSGVKRTVGPSRRSPSLKHRHSWEGSSVDSSPPQQDHQRYFDEDNNNSDDTHFLQHRHSAKDNRFFPNGFSSVSSRDLEGVEKGDTDRDRWQEQEEEEEDSHGDVLIIHEVDNQYEKVDVVSVERKVKSHRSYADVVNGWTTNNNSDEGNHRQDYAQSPDVKGDSPTSATTALTLLIPPLDLSTLHEHIDGVDARPVSNDQVSSQAWVNLAAPADQNTPVVSPRSNKMKKRNGPSLKMPAAVVQCITGEVEAPMSPSAYSGPVPFSVSVNTDIPPSPPIHQDLYKKQRDDECSHRLRQLTKKIQGLKKKIKAFEENFEKNHGYRPSQGERAAQPDIKKLLNELSKARRDLKALKENTEKTNRSRHNSGASSSGQEMSPPVHPTVASTLEVIMQGLTEKRREMGRPEDIVLMTRDQVQQEKLDVQKVLLRFEGLHGRPTTKDDKDLMRPLYDRYRLIKRILAKPVSPRNSLELQPVPEEHIMEIPRTFNRAPIHVPTAHVEIDPGGHSPDLGTTTDCFGIVTRDFSRLGTAVRDHLVLHDIDLPPPHREMGDNKNREGEDEEEEEEAEWRRKEEEKDSKVDAHLHELSLSQLHMEIEATRREKKKLRKVLREFEEDFLIQHGRKVQKEDRYPLQSEYGDYKKVKARMRLLEALVLKHHE